MKLIQSMDNLDIFRIGYVAMVGGCTLGGAVVGGIMENPEYPSDSRWSNAYFGGIFGSFVGAFSPILIPLWTVFYIIDTVNGRKDREPLNLPPISTENLDDHEEYNDEDVLDYDEYENALLSMVMFENELYRVGRPTRATTMKMCYMMGGAPRARPL